MAKYEAGFIGAGNMGGALALAAAKKTGGDRIAVACSTRERSEAAAQRLGCTAETPQRILSDSRFVFLGVKPQMVVGVVESLKADILASEGIFVSMLAGVSLEKLALLLGADKKIIRIMPNTPCAVGQGLILYAANGRVSEDELCAFRELMAPAGALDELNEHLIDAASAVSGCGPAYAYLFIEALADGGVKNGLPRAKAQRYAAQMLLGSAEMVLRTGRHPGHSLCRIGVRIRVAAVIQRATNPPPGERKASGNRLDNAGSLVSVVGVYFKVNNVVTACDV